MHYDARLQWRAEGPPRDDETVWLLHALPRSLSPCVTRSIATPLGTAATSNIGGHDGPCISARICCFCQKGTKKFTKARQSCLGKKCKELKSPRRPVRKKGGLLSALLSFLSICPCYSCSQLGGDQTGCRKSRLGNALLLRAYNSYSVLNTSLCTRSTKKGGKREA